MCVLNVRSLAKLIEYDLDIVKMAGSPTIASLIMGVITFFLYKGLIYLIHSNLIATCISIVVAVVIYALIMVLTRGVTEEELYMFPKGDAIVRLLDRFHLL